MITFNHPNKVKQIVYTFIGRILPVQFLTKCKLYGGHRFFAWCNFLTKSQWFSKNEIAAYQKKHLMRIIEHCCTHVPFYRSCFSDRKIKPDDIRDLNDLSLLPIINKDILKSKFNDFKADNSIDFSPVEWHTGGSTGKPLKFYHDKSVREFTGALTWRYQAWAGQSLSDRFVMMRSPIGYREGKIDVTTPYKYDPISRMLEINTTNLDAEHVKNALGLFKEFNPAYLHTYPSVANILALFILKNPEYKIQLKGVLSSSEFLYTETRKNIERAFECKVYNFYGMEEAVTFAYECEKGAMHVCFELGIFEIVKDGRPCKTGEIGELVCTGLHNYSMPLIRYATGDFGYFKDGECSCGRNMPVIEVYGGREKDLLVTRSGIVNIVSSVSISDNIKGLKEFQIIQEDLDTIVVKIVKDDDYADTDKDEILRGLRNLLGNDIRIMFEFTDKIPRSSAGKFKFVISNVPIQFN